MARPFGNGAQTNRRAARNRYHCSSATASKFSVLDIVNCKEDESKERSKESGTQSRNVPTVSPLIPPVSTRGNNGGAIPVPVGPQGQPPKSPESPKSVSSPVTDNSASRVEVPIYSYKPLEPIRKMNEENPRPASTFVKSSI